MSGLLWSLRSPFFLLSSFQLYRYLTLLQPFVSQKKVSSQSFSITDISVFCYQVPQQLWLLTLNLTVTTEVCLWQPILFLFSQCKDYMVTYLFSIKDNSSDSKEKKNVLRDWQTLGLQVVFVPTLGLKLTLMLLSDLKIRRMAKRM